MNTRSILKPIAIGLLLYTAGGCSDGSFKFRERSPISEDGSTEYSPKSGDAETSARSENPASETPRTEDVAEVPEDCSLLPLDRETLDQVPRKPCHDVETEVESPNQGK